MSGLIRITDPNRLGIVLGNLRAAEGWTRRELAREICAVTGRTQTSVNSQLWTWDSGKARPESFNLGPYLAVIGYDLALVLREDT